MGSPKFRAFFHSPASIFVLFFSLSLGILSFFFSLSGVSSRVIFSLSGCLFVSFFLSLGIFSCLFFLSLRVFSCHFGGVLVCRDPQLCAFSPSGCRVKAPGGLPWDCAAVTSCVVQLSLFFFCTHDNERTRASSLWVVLPPHPSFCRCCCPILVWGRAAFSCPFGVLLSPSPSWWCCLPPTIFGWCCLHLFTCRWCCFTRLVWSGAALPPPLGGAAAPPPFERNYCKKQFNSIKSDYISREPIETKFHQNKLKNRINFNKHQFGV